MIMKNRIFSFLRSPIQHIKEDLKISKELEKRGLEYRFPWLVYYVSVALWWVVLIYKIINGLDLGVSRLIAAFILPVGWFLFTTILSVSAHLYIEYGGEESSDENWSRFYRKKDREIDPYDRYARYVLTYIIINLAMFGFFNLPDISFEL